MIVVIGDLLLDREIVGEVKRLAPDAPVPVLSNLEEGARLGGAGLAAQHIRNLGEEVLLIAAVAHDEDGDLLRKLSRRSGIALHELETSHPTRVKERYGTNEQILFRVDRGNENCEPVDVKGGLFDICKHASSVLVSDYGGGVTHHPEIRKLISALTGRTSVVWDPHPRGGAPVERLALVTPNRNEARVVGDIEKRACELASIWNSPVAITSGSNGAVACLDGSTSRIYPARRVSGDPCGAGDAFAAAVTVALSRGEDIEYAIARGVEHASDWVAIDKRLTSKEIVVATGGCFDLLHVGHIATLRAAAALGDRLVVLLNSDSSVRELKGSNRPINSQDDRAAMLRALSMVDDVVIFEELTPEVALAKLQPDIWVKGGDYDSVELPENVLVKQWGGEVVIAPYLDGYSSSQIASQIN